MTDWPPPGFDGGYEDDEDYVEAVIVNSIIEKVINVEGVVEALVGAPINVAPTATAVLTSSNGLIVNVSGASSVDSDGTLTSFQWDWDDGTALSFGSTATHTYAAAGTYDITLTVIDNRGGSDTATLSVTVPSAPPANVAPNAAFSIAVTNMVATVNAGASTDSDGTIVSYVWNWGDGTPNTSGVTALHTYQTPGQYVVTLTVTDDDGATDTAAESRLYPPVEPVNTYTRFVVATDVGPQANTTAFGGWLPNHSPRGTLTPWTAGNLINATSVAAMPLEGGKRLIAGYRFSGSVSIRTANVIFRDCEFWGPATSSGLLFDNYGAAGAGTMEFDHCSFSFATVANPSFVPATGLGSGILNLSYPLIVHVHHCWFKNGECIKASDFGLYEHNLLHVSTDTNGETGHVDGIQGSGHSLARSKYDWTARHNTIIGGVVPTAAAIAAGATNDRGEKAGNIGIWSSAYDSNPQIAYGVIMEYNYIDGFNTGCWAQATDPADPSIIRHNQFGRNYRGYPGGTIRTGEQETGLYRNGVVVENNNIPDRYLNETTGYTSSYSGNFPPVASFDIDQTGAEIDVDASATTQGTGNILTYSWNWGDGTANGSGVTASHTYAGAGTYNVTLTVTDDEGEIGIAVDTVTVAGNVAPVARFVVTQDGMDVTVNGGTSTDSDGTITDFDWDYDDTNTATGAAPATHTYSTPGSYDISLTVTDDGGATHTKVTTVIVPPNAAPVAAFDVTVDDLTVTVDAGDSTDSDGTIVSYGWGWGDGTAAGSGATTSHTYAESGTYTITLTVTDNDGATDTLSDDVTVALEPTYTPFVIAADVGPQSATGGHTPQGSYTTWGGSSTITEASKSRETTGPDAGWMVFDGYRFTSSLRLNVALVKFVDCIWELDGGTVSGNGIVYVPTAATPTGEIKFLYCKLELTTGATVPSQLVRIFTPAFATIDHCHIIGDASAILPSNGSAYTNNLIEIGPHPTGAYNVAAFDGRGGLKVDWTADHNTIIGGGAPRGVFAEVAAGGVCEGIEITDNYFEDLTLGVYVEGTNPANLNLISGNQFESTVTDEIGSSVTYPHTTVTGNFNGRTLDTGTGLTSWE